MTVTPRGAGTGPGVGTGTDADADVHAHARQGAGTAAGIRAIDGTAAAAGATTGTGARSRAEARSKTGTGIGTGVRTGTPVETGPNARSRSRARARARTGAEAAPRPRTAESGIGADVGASVALPAARTVPSSPAKPPEPSSHHFLARAAFITISLSIAGALLGLGRDQALAHFFGAGPETDAFLVAWTVPEFAATLLIEDGLAFLLIPAFSVALARRARGGVGDPVRTLVAATLPKLSLAFTAVSGLLIVGAPYLVAALAPGLPDPGLAVGCTRLTATCVLTFGLAGYCSAALRAHGRFIAPAVIYVAYNTAIITAMFVLGGHWGVRSAALGVAMGGALMVAAQLPSLGRQLGRREAAAAEPGGEVARPMDLTLITTVLLFALCRQSQVLIERFLASSLPAGAISHLNYAQKVAQMPMVLSLMLCTVTFPVVARAIAEGDSERARHRVERDLTVVSCTVLLGAAAVAACAPQIVQLLFQRGAFTAQDTAATAAVMRVYALGLLGHTLVGALVRSYFSTGRPTWYPLVAMTVGIITTSWIGALTVGFWGVCGIAAANAVGVTVSALLLLYGMGPRSVPIHTRRVVAELSKPVRAAAVAAVAGALCASGADSPVLGLLTGGTTVTVVFALLAWALRVQGFAPALRSVTRRLPHVRFR